MTPIIHYIASDKITVPDNRDRKEFGEEELALLAHSISRIGLLHMPVIRHDDQNHHILVVGERRLRAMKRLHADGTIFTCVGQPVPPDMIPVVFYEELDERTAKEVELEENLRRTDLTVQERSDAYKRLDAMQPPGSTYTQTAKVLQERYNITIDPGKVKTMVMLADHFHHPEVKAARTEKDAIKQMYRVMERETNIKIGALLQPSSTVDYRFGDSISEMRKIKPESINVILTDPPYGIDADKMGFSSFLTANHQYADSWKSVQSLIEEFVFESHRVATPSAHLYMFCDIRKFFDLSKILELVGWEVWGVPIIWSKGRGPVPSPDYAPMRTYECILFANKGRKQVLTPLPDVIHCPLESDRDHAAQKPVEVYTNLLKRSAKQGDTVLDPFCGSGTIFLAAKDLSLSAIGIDNDPAMAAVIQRRTAQAP